MKTPTTFEIGQIVRCKKTFRTGIILSECHDYELGYQPKAHYHISFGVGFKTCASPESLEPVYVERFIIDLWTRPSFVPANS